MRRVSLIYKQFKSIRWLTTTVSPITEAYRSAIKFTDQPQFSSRLVTRAEYQESGSNACRRKFRDWQWAREGQGKEEMLVSKGKARAKQKEDSIRPEKAGRSKRTTSTSMKRR